MVKETMVQLVCPCLNIRIHGKGNTVQLRDACLLNLSDNVLADNFFSSQVYDVLLDLGGVTKAQKHLCNTRCIDGWIVTSCLGCETEVYAKHLDDNDRVLVSCSIEKDPGRITTLMESENYSTLFKLLLPEINDNFAQNNIGVELCTYKDSFEPAFNQMQQQVASYLKEEQKAMEERIKVFTEQQQSRYAALQQKVKKHKQAMLYLLLKRKGLRKPLSNVVPTEIVPLQSSLQLAHPSSDDSSSSSDSAHVQDKSSDFQMEALEEVSKASVPPRKTVRRMHSVNNPVQRPKVARPFRQQELDIGDVFSMEGFESEEAVAPFYNSDDEDTDGSSTEDNTHSKPEEPTNRQHVGSLPISVPAWSSYSRYSIHDIEEDRVVVHKDPEQLAASFRALVEGSSVSDGTEIFGDLPRRRLNTGDLIKSRPI